MSDWAGSEEHIERLDRQAACERLLGWLDEEQKGVLSRRYGLGMYPPMTFEEIAQDMGIAVEKVRFIDWNLMGLLQNETIRSVWTGYSVR